ncbi:InlB B-repeat-containing protein [Clostridium sp. FS41]|uniref:InlB B-repeat-containing protein n=1 Tax=Clostridium sp. FS41 TaxID=1609975 RepID=UPI0005D3EECB|nr:InlB B-repeat-containing protein [Clostridium sp. FS41]KJJ69104.1 repeat domain-containing protein [Clostridium sp. FS41]
MKRTKLVKGSAKRAIAVASAFMMTCVSVAASPGLGTATAYAKEAGITGQEADPKADTDADPVSDPVSDPAAGDKAGGKEDKGENNPEAGNGETEDKTESEEGNPETGDGESEGNPEKGDGEAEGNPGAGNEETEGNPGAGDGETEEKPEAGDGETEENPEAGDSETEGNPEAGDGETEGNPEAGDGETEGNPEAGDGETEGTPESGAENPEDQPAKEQQTAQTVKPVQPVAAAQERVNGSWYIVLDEDCVFDEEKGYYYKTDENGDPTDEIIKNEFIQLDNAVIHVGKDGKKETKKWIGDKDGGFRYADSNGEIIMGEEAKAAGKYYGNFADDGYWEAISYTFFENDGKLQYAGKDGKIAAKEEEESWQPYFFENDENGTKCLLPSQSGGTEVTSAWAEDLWIDENGYLMTGDDMKPEKIGDRYYTFDEEGHSTLVLDSIIYDADGTILCYVDENGEMVKNQFVSDGDRTYYFGDDGAQVFRKWIEGVDENGQATFRYINGKGYMVYGDVKVVGGYYGEFDMEGYWTAIENQFFQDKLDDGTEVTKYSGKGGKVAGIGEKDARQDYCFVSDENGRKCYLLSEDGTTMEQAESGWVEDLWVQENGYLLTGQESSQHKIDGKYYNFDGEGHAGLITDSIISNADGTILCGVDAQGNMVREAFFTLGGFTYYFDKDGAQVFHQWIEGVDESGEKTYRFVDIEGYMVWNTTTAAGGRYGVFDLDGYWTAIPNTFFEENDGKRQYSGKDGRIAGAGEGENRQHYSFLSDETGKTKCLLAAETVSSLWIEDLRVDENGYLVTGNDLDKLEIDDKYYTFNIEGHSTLVTNTFIRDPETNNILCYVDENGDKVRSKTEWEIDGNYYNFEADGSGVMITNAFIHDPDGNILYYVDVFGEKVTDEKHKEIDNKFYDFDASGIAALITNSFIYWQDGTVRCYVGEDGAIMKNVPQQEIEGKFYQLDELGAVTLITNSCIYAADGQTVLYYVDEDGNKVSNEDQREINGRYYRLDERGNATLITNAFIYEADGQTVAFYVGADGLKVTNVPQQEVEGKYYSIDGTGKVTLIVSVFITDRENTYYVDEDGTKVTDEKQKEIDGKYYNFDGTGNASLVINAFIHGSDGQTIAFYVGADGLKVTDVPQQEVEGKYYSIDGDGRVTLIVSSFIEVGETTYYVDEDGNKVTNEKQKEIGGKYYSFDGSGSASMIINSFIFNESGEPLYYLDAQGDKVTDRTQELIGEKYYNINADGQVTLVTSEFILKDNGEKICYVDADGNKVISVTGMEIDGKYYNFNESGIPTMIAAGFVYDESGNPLYYLDINGDRITDKQQELIEEKFYDIDADGKVTLIKNSLIYSGDSIWCYVGENGERVTNVDQQPIGDQYYRIDESGNVMLITYEFILDPNGDKLYYMDENGDKITSRTSMNIEGMYYSFDDMGNVTLIINSLIRDGERIICYVGEDGQMVTNAVQMLIEGKYYNIDGRGAVILITDSFIVDSEGRNLFYVGADGNKVINETGKFIDGKYYNIDGNGLASLITDAFVYDRQGKIVCFVDPEGNMVTNANQKLIDGRYYNIDLSGNVHLITEDFIRDPESGSIVCYVGANGDMVTDKFVSDGEHTYYFGTDGKILLRHWIEEVKGGEKKFRYVDGKGRMLVNVTKEVAGYYGTFDSAGYWTALEDQFFSTKLDNGTTVKKYALEGGKVAGTGEKTERWDYCFVNDKTGTLCYLLFNDESIQTPVESTWIKDFWVNERGYLAISADVPVDGVYYRFDQEGHGTLITYKVSYELNGGTNNSANPSGYTGAMSTILLNAPSRSGYTFDGWYTDGSFTNRVTEIAGKSHGNMTLYAKWTVISSSDGSDGSSSGSGSGSSGNSGMGTGNSSADNGTGSANGSTGNTASVTVTVEENQTVTVQTGESTVAASAVQTAAGSISGNTIVSTAEPVTVPVAGGQTAVVATIAVGMDGSSRTLLASQVQGAAVQQKTVTIQGTEVTQNVVVYADGTQVSQKSGTAELEGFDTAVVLAEQAIQSGVQSVAAVYNDKVDIDLHQYQQVGAAVTYEVVAGTNGAVSQTQMEQTSFAPGQEIAALITDANGGVTAITIVVGENGIIQYQIPGVNCVVRFMSKLA